MSAQARPPRPRLALRLALLMALVVPVVPAQAAPTPADPSTQVVAGTTIDVAGLPRLDPDAAPSARAVANARIRTPKATAAFRTGTSRAVSSQPSVISQRAGSSHGVAGANRAIDTAQPGFSSFGFTPIDPRGAWPLDANVAVSPSWVVTASAEQVDYGRTPDGQFYSGWYPYTFFALPTNEYYWRTTAAWSTYRGRFIAVLASHQDETAGCANGYLTIAVSTTNDPAKPWTRFRVAMPDAYSLNTGIGFSDDKVVLTNDQWDLATTADFCEDGTFEGSRVRVVDWADLIDAGTLTVRDLTPAPATDHYAWVAASGVPGTSSALAGTDVHLVGERFDGSAWGDVVYARVSGSAKSGTAAVAGYTDLTTGAAGLRALTPPPATIAAMPSGNGFQDEHIISAAWRAGVLWFSANDSCRLDPDPDFRACARFVRLDTTTSPPTVSEEGLFVDIERDTFLPLVGMSRDGKAWFGMSGSSALAHEPVDQYATYREPGVAIPDGPAEIVVRHGPTTYEKTGWGEIGSMVPDPSHVSTVWQAFPATIQGYPAGARATRLTGGISGDPGVATVVNLGHPWWSSTNAEFRFQPTDTSPVVGARVSGSGTTEDTTDGPRLVQGVDFEFGAYAFVDTGDPAVGGVPGVGPHSAFVQFRMSDGTYSTPAQYSFNVDTTRPTVTSPVSWFYVGKSTAATTAVVRTSWTGADADSGISGYNVTRTGWQANYGPGPGGHVDHSLIFGKGYVYTVNSGDNAGNSSDTAYSSGIKVLAYQGTTSVIKYTNTWKTQSSSSFLGSSTRYATAKGATATFSFTGRAVAIISTRGSNRGKFEVWVDGVRTATVDLHASTRYRTVVWATSWPMAGTHKVMVKVLGTSGHPRVDVDAFLKF